MATQPTAQANTVGAFADAFEAIVANVARVIHGKELPYGLFLGEVVNFLIIAVVLFLFIVKFLGWLIRTR